MNNYINFTNKDYELLFNFAYPIWSECYKGVIPDGQILQLCHKYFDLDNVIDYVKDGYIYKYISINDNNIGFVTYKIYADYIYLDKLYLDSKYRGMHISSKFFNDLIKEFKLPIRLNVNQNNKLGLRSYEGNGFKIIEAKRYDLPNGYVNYDYIMEKAV